MLVEGELGIRVVKFRRGVSVCVTIREGLVKGGRGGGKLGVENEKLTGPGLRLVQRQLSIVVSSEVLRFQRNAIDIQNANISSGFNDILRAARGRGK